MIKLELHEFSKPELRNAVAIVGFPSLGLVGSIATNFLARELGLEIVAGITSSDFPPYTIIQNGKPLPQIRIYSGCRNRKENEDGLDCEEIVIVTSEFVPKIEQYHDIGTFLVRWFADNGIKKVLTLDGIPMFTPDTYEIMGAGSTDFSREMMGKYGIEEFDDGMIRGLSGIVLYYGSLAGMDVISILGSAKSELPDPKGAAKLLEPIGKMMPEINIDTEPLYQEATDLDKKLNSGPVRKENDGILYG